MGTWRSLAVWMDKDLLQLPNNIVPLEYGGKALIAIIASVKSANPLIQVVLLAVVIVIYHCHHLQVCSWTFAWRTAFSRATDN